MNAYTIKRIKPGLWLVLNIYNERMAETDTLSQALAIQFNLIQGANRV